MILPQSMVQKTRFFPHRMVGIGLGIAALFFWASVVPFVAELVTGREVLGLALAVYIAVETITGIGLAVGCAGLAGAAAARDRIFSTCCLIVAFAGLLDSVVTAVNLGRAPGEGTVFMLELIWFSVLGSFLLALALLIGGLAYLRGADRRNALLAWAFTILALMFAVKFGQRFVEVSPPWKMLASLEDLAATVTQVLLVVVSGALAYQHFRTRQVLTVQRQNWPAGRDLLVAMLAIVYIVYSLPPDPALWRYWQWYSTPILWVHVVIPVFTAVGFFVSWWLRGGFETWRQKLAPLADEHGARDDAYWSD